MKNFKVDSTSNKRHADYSEVQTGKKTLKYADEEKQMDKRAARSASSEIRGRVTSIDN
jgi:hypothetical protein